MIQISKIIEDEKQELSELKSSFKKNKIVIEINPADFKELFLIQVNKIIISRNINREFIINQQNSEIINQVYYYCVGNEKKFNGKVEKGLMLVGKNGVGKTLIIKAYCEIIALLTRWVIIQIHSKKLQQHIIKGEIEGFEKKPLFIDDIGKESKEVVDYGTKIMPIPDLMALRYDNGAITFATCNYNMSTLEEFYGKTTTDRFKEMFNIIELKGESFRK